MLSTQDTKTFWKCPEGCALSRAPCPHLEALLPGPRDADLPLADAEQLSKLNEISPNVDDLIALLFSGQGTVGPTGTGEADLIKQLNRYGLSFAEKELILQRYVEGISLSKLAKAHRYFDHKGVARHIGAILQKLRDNGFGAERKGNKK